MNPVTRQKGESQTKESGDRECRVEGPDQEPVFVRAPSGQGVQADALPVCLHIVFAEGGTYRT